jgi:N-acetylglucosamine-6-phosphate deacetylase
MPEAPHGIWAERAVTPDGVVARVRVRVEGGRIAALERGVDPAPGDAVHPAATLLPGLIDLQVNGADGAAFSDPDPAARRRVLDWHLRRGTTALAATLISAAPDELVAALRRLATDAAAEPALAGIHLEGPFLAGPKAGAHPRAWLRAPDPALLERLLEAAGGALRLLTLAPELPGALDAIARLSRAGVVCAAGHTLASYACMQQAVERGLSLVTHVGNACDWPTRVFDARAGYRRSEPGVVGAFLAEPRLRATVILDGHHLHPALARALVAARGARALALVSDAAPFAGLGPGVHELWGMRAQLDERGFATAGEGLAGSTVSLGDALRVAVQVAGLPLASASEMASAVPADILGLGTRKGRIAPGFDADLLVADAELRPLCVYRAGRAVDGCASSSRPPPPKR